MLSTMAVRYLLNNHTS